MANPNFPNIMDAHAHIFPQKISYKAVDSILSFYDELIPEMEPGKGTVSDLLTSGTNAGINYFLVSSTATRPEQVESINDFIADVCKDNRFIGFGTIHPEYPHPQLEIERAASLGIKGLKLHPDFQQCNIDDAALLPIYQAAEGRLPILFHIGDIRTDYSSPRRLARVLDMFPDLVVIAAHLGGWSLWDEFNESVYKKNVYIDTSSSLMLTDRETAVRIIRTHGVDKVLFGTDYPMWSPEAEIERFLSLGLTQEENQKILWDNARQLFHI
ncbi:amidohydrolase family protein [Dehalobacter sp. DCM]|uniref:amidohydrolase family protein n=1 Tax=Dehalobacter sp. DCM TaxID=2907827 RepID=UPI003081F4C8|nr:amidohydrolase family protein [Dehalobacter sp. DCM]